MATATKARPRKAKAKPDVPSPDDVLAVANDVTDNVLIERKTEMRTILRGAIAGVNIHQLGPPGTAKSLGLREFCMRIEGAELDEQNAGDIADRARYFEKAVHAQMPADAIIGGYDMANFARTGEFARNVEHYAPNAHFVFLDEVTRANGPTLDALLPMLNSEERRAEANGGMFTTPILFVVTASNYMPDPDDAHLGALVNRFTLMMHVDRVKADDSFKEMFRRHHARAIAELDKTTTRVTITLEQFKAAQIAARRIEPTPDFLDAYAKLRREAHAAGLMLEGDRAWMELGRVCRACAWLAGRDELVPDDLAAIEPGLWRERKDMAAAAKLVQPFKGRFEQAAAEKRQEAAKPLAKVAEIRPEVEGTPPNEELPQDVLAKALSANREITKVKDRVDKVLAEAAREKRDAAELQDLADELAAVQTWMEDKVGLPPQR